MILRKEYYERYGLLKVCYLTIRLWIAFVLRLFLMVRGGSKSVGLSSDGEVPARGLPYLTIKKDGSLKCTSCMLCVSYCPSSCISIDSKYGKTVGNEGPPESFKIEVLKCIFCGFCEEACPADAIRMSTKQDLSDHAEQEWVVDQSYLAFRDELNQGKGVVSTVAQRSR